MPGNSRPLLSLQLLTDVCLVDISLYEAHNIDMKGFYEEFGRRLRESRNRAGLTQEALGKRVGLSRTAITNIELGNQQVQLHRFVLLSSAIGIEPQELLPDNFALDDEEILSSDMLEGLAKEEQEWVRRTVRAGTTSVKEGQ